MSDDNSFNDDAYRRRYAVTAARAEAWEAAPRNDAARSASLLEDAGEYRRAAALPSYEDSAREFKDRAYAKIIEAGSARGADVRKQVDDHLGPAEAQALSSKTEDGIGKLGRIDRALMRVSDWPVVGGMATAALERRGVMPDKSTPPNASSTTNYDPTPEMIAALDRQVRRVERMAEAEPGELPHTSAAFPVRTGRDIAADRPAANEPARAAREIEHAGKWREVAAGYGSGRLFEGAKMLAGDHLQKAREIRESAEAGGIWRKAIEAGREAGASPVQQQQETRQPRQ